jgi:hypothetical protein
METRRATEVFNNIITQPLDFGPTLPVEPDFTPMPHKPSPHHQTQRLAAELPTLNAQISPSGASSASAARRPDKQYGSGPKCTFVKGVLCHEADMHVDGGLRLVRLIWWTSYTQHFRASLLWEVRYKCYKDV